MNAKPWWQSKTIWTNVLAGVALVEGYLPGPWAVAVPIANLILRAVTKQPITT